MEDNLTENTSLGKTIRKILFRIFCLVFATFLMCLGFAYGLLALICNGPSETAKERFVKYALADERMAFLPGLCLSDEEIAAIDAMELSYEDYKEAANG